MKFITQHNYLSKQGALNLDKYTYNGGDSSYIYKYIMSPLAQFYVDKLIPKWLAPNMITLIAFLFNVIPHFIFLIAFNGNLEGELPKYLYFLFCLLQFNYMILDNADGKQARKTKSSSPLGLLFDHGCDALTATIVALNYGTTTQFGNGLTAHFACLIATVPFYTSTLEEFYVDGLYLPVFNGPNEGIMTINICYILTGIFGTQMWNVEYFGFRQGQIIVIMSGINGVFTVIGSFMNIYQKNKPKLTEALFHSIPILLHTIAYLVVVFLSVDNVSFTHTRLVCSLFGILHAKQSTHIQISHVANEKLNQFRITIIATYIILIFNTLSGYILGASFINEANLIIGLFIITLLVYSHLIYNAIRQLKYALGIHCFSITKKRQRKIE